MTFDLQVHVDLGFDTVRKHIKVEPRRWYYHADRLGLLVWQDMPSTFAAGERGRAAFRRELRAMVEQLGNHPCIEMWVPFNEGWGAHDVDATAKAVASWDSGRLVNRMSGYDVCGCPGPGGDVAAVHNYVGPGPAPDDDDRAAVVDEFGGIGLAITGHLWNPAREYSYASASSRADLTESYVRLTEELRRLAIKEDIAGGIWTQLTDVEREINGLYTYDRTVEKVDRDRVREANRTLRRVFDVPREAVGAGVPGGRGD